MTLLAHINQQAFSSQAKARAAETKPSTSGREKLRALSTTSRTPAGPEQPESPSAPSTSSITSEPDSESQPSKLVPQGPSPASLAAASSHLPPSRLIPYVQNILHRELMLKLRPRGWDQVPRLASVEAHVRGTETHLNDEEVEKSELLMYALALEMLTGRPAVFMPPGNAKNSSTRASGVYVRLNAITDPNAAYSFMEKLVHVILPNQVGFSGVPPLTLVTPPPGDKAAAARAAKLAALDHRKDPLRPYTTEFRVTNLLQYPDFEQNFWLFEQLGGIRVRLVVEGVNAADCGLLLSGLSVPILTGAAAEAALAELAAEALRRSRAEA